MYNFFFKWACGNEEKNAKHNKKNLHGLKYIVLKYVALIDHTKNHFP